MKIGKVIGVIIGLLIGFIMASFWPATGMIFVEVARELSKPLAKIQW